MSVPDAFRSVALFLLVPVLLAGCDGFDSGVSPNESAQDDTGPTVRFAASGAGAVPDDGTVSVEVEYVSPDAEATVEVLFATASTTTDDDVTIPRVQELNFPAADTTVTRSFEIDISSVDITQGQKTALFALQNLATDGAAEIGSPKQFELSVGPKPIVEAQADGAGSVVTVQGTVTRAAGAYARIQDDSGPTGASGLVIRQTGDRDFATDIADGEIQPGTEVIVTGTLSDFNGLLQINDDDLNSYRILSQGEPPAPQQVTLATLSESGDNYLSELVRIEGLSFPSASGSFSGGTSYTVEGPDGNQFTFRVQGSDETNIAGASIPEGAFTYEGVVGVFSGEFQLIPMEDSDIVQSSE